MICSNSVDSIVVETDASGIALSVRLIELSLKASEHRGTTLYNRSSHFTSVIANSVWLQISRQCRLYSINCTVEDNDFSVISYIKQHQKAMFRFKGVVYDVKQENGRKMPKIKFFVILPV